MKPNVLASSDGKKLSPGGGQVKVIPTNMIKMQNTVTSSGLFKESKQTILGGSSEKQNQTRLKVQKKKTEPLTENAPVSDPKIMTNSTRTLKPPETENLYGLDISILKSLNMDYLLEEKKAQEEQNTS